ncbi:uncharacterized protein [Primulina eburnea]|uniref:uncharacterized protein n=1 Tax=Primulina eburnea TaxID=1245227 RepID=UPI003C6C9940
MTHFSKVPMFSKKDFDDWKIRMQAHLAVQDNDIWFVITNGPLKIIKPNTAIAVTEGAPQMLQKQRSEWTSEDTKKSNLDNIAKDILYKTLDKNTFSKIKMCPTKKEIWMKAGETLSEFDERFNNLVNELVALGKELGNREVTFKVLRALPKE